MKEHCPFDDESLDDYLDGVLSGEIRIRYESHLPDCEPCRIALETHQLIENHVREHAWKLDPRTTDSQSISVPPNATSVLLDATSVLLDATSVLPNAAHNPAGESRYLAKRAAALKVAAAMAATLSFVAVLWWSHARPEKPVAEQELVPRPAIEANKMPVIRKVRSSSHVSVVQPTTEDELTFIMLYPTVPLSTESD